MNLKKVFFSIILLIFFSGVKSQSLKGKTMVGTSIGTAAFTNNSTDLSNNIDNSTTTNRQFGISISPTVGWFKTDNLAIGFSPIIEFVSKKILGKASNGNTFLKDESNQYSFGMGGFARYYFGTNNTVRLFGHYNLQAGISGNKSDGFEYEKTGLFVDRYNYKSSGNFFVNTGLNFGVSKFLSANTSVDFFIGYKLSLAKSSPDGTSLRDYSDPLSPDENQNIKYDQNVTEHGVTIGVGFQIFLDKKK